MLALIFIVPIALFGALPLAFAFSVAGIPFWTSFWISFALVFGGGVCKFIMDKKKKETR